MAVQPISQPQALIYCRVSTRSQEEVGSSLETQEAACVKKALESGYVVGRVTREVFSGAELWDRPLLSRDRADLATGRYQAVIAYATDRLSRDPVHLMIVAEECERSGVDLIFVTEPLDATPEGQLIQYVKGYAAKIEREKIRERSLRGRRARLESGKLQNAGPELYGYRRNKETGKRVIYEPEAGVVRHIYRWYTADRLALHEIARRLNGDGTPSPKQSKGLAPMDAPPMWTASQIKYLLDNPAYKGETVAWRIKFDFKHKRHTRHDPEEWVRLPDGTTPALVTLEVWDQAQQRREPNRAAAKRNKRQFFLLRGLIVCAGCGRPRYPGFNHGYRRYKCASLQDFGHSCGSKVVPADEIEAAVWESVARVLEDPGVIAAEVERRKTEGSTAALETDLASVRRSLARIERQQEKLLRQYRQSEEDSFPWELVQREIAHAEQEKAQLRAMETELLERKTAETMLTDHLAALSTYCATVSENLAALDDDEKRLAVEALGIRVRASGKAWEVTASVPLGPVGTTSIKSTRAASTAR